MVDIFGKQLIFSHDETKGEELRLFDVYLGYYYEDRSPKPLLKEGIRELRWFDLEEVKKLELTKITQRAVDFLEKKTDRTFLSECLHHLQVVINLAQSEGASEVLLEGLRRSLDESIATLSLVSLTPKSEDKPEDHCLEEEKIVLIVDDHPEMLETLRDAFELQGYKAYIFSNPNEALPWIKLLGKKIRALIVDYHLPGIKGNILIEQVKNYLNPKAKIIMISDDEPQEKEKAGTIFFKKILLPNELIRAIEEQ